MTSNKQPMNERQAFDDLLGKDRFDDSVNEQHQSSLRSDVLQAFGQSHTDASPVELAEDPTSKQKSRRASRVVGLAVMLAVCLFGLVAAWIYSGDSPDERNIVEEPSVAEDSHLVASLDEVNLFREEVSPEALFFAIAMCEVDHEGRTRSDSLQP